MSIRFKVIKPATLKASVFKSAFVDAAKDVAGDMHDDLDAITENWRHKVTFDETVSASGDTVKVSVLTDDLGFKYYDQGNGGPGRIIRPLTAKALHWIDKDGNDVFRKYVRGYEGRFAVAKLHAAWAKNAKVYFELAMSEAALKSGNSI